MKERYSDVLDNSSDLSDPNKKCNFPISITKFVLSEFFTIALHSRYLKFMSN